MIFHDFSWPPIIFHNFPGLENEILKFHYFFHDPPEPCAQKKKQNKTKQNKQTNKKLRLTLHPPPSAN